MWNGISIHVSARETTSQDKAFTFTIDNFNPRLRKGDDGELMRLTKDGKISIHVSARETTDVRVVHLVIRN